MNVVITGTSRGIGLELARRYADRGDRVLAAARAPRESEALADLARTHEGLSLHVLDVASEASVRAFAANVSDVPVDLLINNAGLGSHGGGLPEATASEMIEVFTTNSVGPVIVTRALLPNLRARAGAKVVSITSSMGFIKDHSVRGSFAYRMSKAALNMAAVLMAVELAADGIISVVLDPGWVRTDMGGEAAALSVEDSVAGMMRVIDDLALEHSGGAFRHDGDAIPY